jgi:hypothetical protein
VLNQSPIVIYPGTPPPVSAFAGIYGTSIVIDSTNTAYYLAAGNVVTPIGGSGNVTLTDAATINVTPADSTIYTLLCTSAIGATRLINWNSPTDGTTWNLNVIQPASGGPCAVTFSANQQWGLGGLAAQPAGATAASACDTYGFEARVSGTQVIGAQIGQAGPTGAAGATGATGPGGSSNFAGTSTTSNTVGTGSLTFTTQSGLAYNVGARIRISSSATPANYVEGVCTAYSGTSLTILSDAVGGSGAFTSWNLNIAGQPGAAKTAFVVGSNGGDISTTSTSFVDVTGMVQSIAASVGDRIIVEYVGIWYLTSGAGQSPKVSFKINTTDLTTMWGSYSIGTIGYFAGMNARACFTAAAGNISGGLVTAQARMQLQAAGTLLAVNSGGVNPTLTITNLGP